MKLLVLTNNPNRPSFRQRIEIYLETLGSNNIHCEVAKLPGGELSRLKLFKLAANFDGVFLQKKCLNFFDAFFLRHYSKKIIYDFDDAIMYSPDSPASNQFFRYQPFNKTMQLANMVIAGNSYLAEHAKKFNHNVKILPTGLDTRAYRLDTTSDNDGNIRLVWIGSKSTLKYLTEIKPALEKIGKRFGNVILRIICNEFFGLENMKVEKRQWSLENQAIDLVTSDIGLAPLPDNRFTKGKCGFKALQYAAAGLPTVTSPIGVNAEYVLNGQTGFHAEQPADWIEKISALIKNSNLRMKMGAAAKKQAEKFDSKIIGEKLVKLITECIKPAVQKIEKVKAKHIPSVRLSSTGKPKVSICIPTYNRKEYLRETINSVLAQTYKDYEIVIVDDGSTDGTEIMLKQLDIPVVYHWQENGGDAAARNKLIKLAQGEYISFIDSDDLLMPDAVEKMVNAIEAQSDAVIVYGSYYRINEKGHTYSKCKRKLYSGKITRHLFETILVHSCGSIFPAKILKNSPLFDTSLKVCSDYDLWLRLSLKHRFIALNEPTFKRRRHPGNLSYASFENCLTEFEVLKRFYNENGGKEVIPEKTANKVLSKEACRTGRFAIKEGKYKQACQLLGQSFRLRPNLKSLIHWIIALILNRTG